MHMAWHTLTLHMPKWGTCQTCIQHPKLHIKHMGVCLLELGICLVKSGVYSLTCFLKYHESIVTLQENKHLPAFVFKENHIQKCFRKGSRDMLVPRRISFWGVLKIYQIAMPGFERGAWCSRCWSFPSPFNARSYPMHDQKDLEKIMCDRHVPFLKRVCVIVAICCYIQIFNIYILCTVYVFFVKMQT